MKKRLLSLLLAAVLTLALLTPIGIIPALAAEQTTQKNNTGSGSFARVTGKDLATVRYYPAGTNSGDYKFANVRETQSGYSYSFNREAGKTYTVVAEYFTTGVWDGAVDISWYNANAREFHLQTPAQLAGLAALVNGMVNTATPDYRIKGDRSLLSTTAVEDTTGGGNSGQTVKTEIFYMASNTYDFAGKTVYLDADMDMGGKNLGSMNENSNSLDPTNKAVNWTPIGGRYCMDPDVGNYQIVSYFNGVLDGQGHRIKNLYCMRYCAAQDFFHTQNVGFIGHIGGQEDNDTRTITVQPAVKNLSVEGFVYGRRMTGGIIGQIGDVPCGVTVTNCANYANVYSTDAKGCGGIVGAGWAEKGAIINCYNTGTIRNSPYGCPTGGIVGENSNLDIYCCYNAGYIYGSGNRGRGIGAHESGSYTVDNCYTLEGQDNDAISKGYYRGTSGSSVNVTVASAAHMRSRELVTALNVNGEAYVFNSDGYPRLFWETEGYTTANRRVTVAQTTGGAIRTVPAVSSVKNGTVLFLENTPEGDWAFRSYLDNGKVLSGDYVTVSADARLEGSFVMRKPGVLNIESNPACEIRVLKTGWFGSGSTKRFLQKQPIQNGDEVKEGDILYATAVWRSGAYPDDPDLVYQCMTDPTLSTNFEYSYTYTDGTSAGIGSDGAMYTVTDAISKSGASLTLTVEAKTIRKTWKDPDIADTAWYSPSKNSFTLTTAAQLGGLAKLVAEGNSFSGKTISLGRDISLQNTDGSYGTRCWPGIGTAAKPFSGSFDGGGYMVSEMTAYSYSDRAGFFGSCDGAEVKNLCVSGNATAAGSYAAGVAAYAKNSTFTYCVSYAEVTGGGSFRGGIVGKLDVGCALEGCVSYGDISGTDSVGGIAGALSGAGCTVKGCLNYGSIIGSTASGSSGGVGGCLGQLSGAGARLEHCGNYGAVSGGSWYMGGVVGNLAGSGTAEAALTDCCNLGTVKNGSSYANAVAGGIAGTLNYADLKNCFNYGAVSAAKVGADVGAIAGYNWCSNSSSISNCYYLDSSADRAYVLNSTVTNANYWKGLVSAVTANRCRTLAATLGSSFTQSASYPELTAAKGTAHIHTGGRANCHSPAICTLCRMPYGNLDPNNHDGGRETRGRIEPVWLSNGSNGDVCCVGCGKVLSPGKTIPADPGKIVFKLYEQDAAGKRTLKKAFTIQELQSLSETKADGYGYQYWGGANSQGGTGERMIVATQFVTFEKLFKAAGMRFGAGDAMAVGSQAAVPYEIFRQGRWYFKSATNKIEVPACLAFAYERGQYPQTVADIAAEASVTETLCVCYGAYDYMNEGGFRLVVGAQEITIMYPDSVAGDVNGDGKINSLDVTRLRKYLVGLAELDAKGLAGADVNGDGKVNSLDVTRLRKYLVGLATLTR